MLRPNRTAGYGFSVHDYLVASDEIREGMGVNERLKQQAS